VAECGLPLGPPREQKSIPESCFFERALFASRSCGVTRLADITRLDRLGLPVWQAIRPAGRALSVHQGKGASPLSAKIGALCEAIESHCGETAPADGPRAAFRSLGAGERAPALSDYSRSRSLPLPHRRPIQWCLGRDLVSGSVHYLPHDLVSLDFVSRGETCFDRSSSGLGAGASEADALQTSLSELVERDAVGEWERLTPIRRMLSAVAPDSISFEWFRGWRGRLLELGLALRLFAPASVTGMPVFLCWVEGDEQFGPAYRRFAGSGAHGNPEIALFKAVAEAFQSRLTFIAAARDDMLPSHYVASHGRLAQSMPPLPPGFRAREWREIRPGPPSADALAEALLRAGYRQIVVKRLDPGTSGVIVTKAFVPGLGSATRERRPPQWR
jgi:ribosomal protein S12 methylthiotransferase accessory factor